MLQTTTRTTFSVVSLFLLLCAAVIDHAAAKAAKRRLLPLPENYCKGKHAQTLHHPYNCYQFVKCVGDTGHIQNCPASLMFNKVSGNCDYKFNVRCEGSPCNMKNGPTNGGCQHTCIYINHYSYRCACKAGYQLDFDEKTCKKGSAINIATYCDGEKRFASLSHPFACDNYVTCMGGGTAVVLKCPSGLWWNSNSKQCDWKYNVQCPSDNYKSWSKWGACFTEEVRESCVRTRQRDCKAGKSCEGGYAKQAKNCREKECRGSDLENPCDSLNGGCSDVCTNGKKVAICSCNEGRQLEADKKTCSADRCGVAPLRGDNIVSFIIAGMDAPLGSYPWQVAIYYTNKATGKETFHCGGSLIDKRHVLSAAHCFPSKEAETPSAYRIVLGDNDRRNDDGSEQSVNIKTIKNHEKFNTPSGSLKNDISLLTLTEDAVYTDLVAPICLPNADEELLLGKTCRISGWGSIYHMSSKPDQLQEVTVPFVPHDVCQRQNDRTRKVYPTMLCTGFNDGSTFKSACHGDSGGPLSCLTGGVWKLYGIVSWGSSQCSALDTYNVFTKVNMYREWIKRNKN